MKKKDLIIIAIISIIIIVFFGYVIFKNVEQKNKEYEIEEIEEYNYFVIKEDNKFGVIDNKANKIIEAKYESVKIPNPMKAVFFCEEDERVKVFNDKSEELFTGFEEIELLKLKNVSSDLVYEKSVLKYTKNGKFGLIDFNGKKITKAIYDEIDTLQFKEGELLVKKDGKYGVINIKGTVLVKAEYDKIEADKYYDEQEGYKKSGYIVSNITNEGYRYGYINVKGEQLLETKFNQLYRVNEIDNDKIYIICAENGKYGLYKNDKKIISNDYQSLNYDERSNVLVATKGKRYGVIGIDGNVKIPFQYNQIDITGEYIYVTDNNGVRVLDKSGNEVDIDKNTVIIDIKNTDYEVHIENIENRTNYSIYKSNERKTNNNYTYIEYLYENYFIVCDTNGKLGIIDDSDNIKVKLEYNTIKKIENFEMIQAEKIDNKITEIYSKSMEKLCEMQNSNIQVKENYIKIYNDNEIIYISRDEKIVQNIEIFENNKIFAKYQDGKWGFIDKNGNTIIDYKYDKVTEVNEYGFAGINSDGKWGSIDRNGNIIVEPIYDLNIESDPMFIGEYYQVIYGNGEIYYTK